jgi:hypothetical protein
MSVKRIILVGGFLISCLSNSLYAQFDDLNQSTNWYRGEIKLRSEKTLVGFIQNNDRLGLIKFKTNLDTDDTEESFQEKSILALEYFDTDRNKLRIFYSFNYKSEESGFSGSLLFEVIKDFKTFAVLSKKSKMDLVGKDNSGMEGFSKAAGLIIGQKEGFFCVDETGKLEYFLIVEYTMKDGIMRDKKKNKIKYKEAVLRKYFNEHWDEIKEYAAENGLRFSNKDDIVSLLDQYDLLSN